ncbi:MAG: CHRD domain-containing protein [Myxococcales bacterium]|nr:CHRD domain-containing protein [Myxococcales bacterium]
MSILKQIRSRLSMGCCRKQLGRYPSQLFGVLLLVAAFGGATLVAENSYAQQGCLTPPGDFNADNTTNVVDVQCAILVALWELGGQVGAQPLCLAVPVLLGDTNCDDARNVVDVQIVISYSLKQPLNPTIDADANQCPDACELFVPVCGDGLCTDGAENCFTCPGDCGACTGDCCSANGTPGCQDNTTTLLVCSINAACCTDTWGSACASLAGQFGACKGDCCDAGTNLGCSDSAVETCVCNLDPFCCEQAWDSICVSEAQTLCGLDCPAQSDCCSTSDIGGCTNFQCETCVCNADPFCCDSAWDEFCVSVATGLCAVSQSITATPQGSQHNPPVPSGGSGTATFTLNGMMLSYVITYKDLDGVEIAAHIHQAPPGENGPVVIPLPDGTPKIGSALLTPTLLTELVAGNLYVNIHSDLYPNGELRGQISVVNVDGPCLCNQPCCDDHNSPGCEDDSCEGCVCALDGFCCGIAWDTACVASAKDNCADFCGCGVGDCCSANGSPGCGTFDCEACVCAADSFCCDTMWDDVCAGEAQTTCAGQCSCPPGDCCTASSVPGCDNVACTDCVCSLDTFCCDTAWDTLCVDAAGSEDCNASCLCNSEDCCQPHSSAGCDDADCSECVCNLDSFCCDVGWDNLCVATAGIECNAACSCQPFAGTEDCCFTHTTAGCDNLPCQNCVCSTDAFCCGTAWDSLCVSIASDQCGSACGCPANDCCGSHDDTGCNNPACEACVCGLDGFCCDTAWDSICVGEAGLECNSVCLCDAGDCCLPNNGPGCNAPACEACVCAADPFCCDTAWDNLCVSQAALDCNDACQCISQPGEGSCCVPTGAAGCKDELCQSCVCGNDPFCCSTGWDNLCVAEASAGCNDVCDCPDFGAGDCCTALDTPGCGNPLCQDCVCALDTFCCDVTWDGLCVAEAASNCTECGCPNSDCCAPKGEPGCDDAECESCVCALDDFCCSVSWDELCVTIAAEDCGPLCGCFGVFATGDCCAPHIEPGCETPACQSCVCTNDDFCCDVGWDEVCVQFAAGDCSAACGCGAAPEGDCCAANGTPGCAVTGCTACVCDIDDTCCTTEWTDSCATVAQTACDTDCGCEAANDCCFANGGLGCSDADCQSCVCALDDFCCEVTWDEICVSEAALDCDSACNCP